ncbi:MAG TPA: hypothetical protein DEB39_13935 [Planctomycetaceae bacterium]|nr:hypothetical protein [Planctomycetaceae bacterium]
MPLYEFECSKCQAIFEELVRDNRKTCCPHCGSKRLTRLMSAPVTHASSGQSCPGSACPGSGFCEPSQMPCCGSRGCAH